MTTLEPPFKAVQTSHSCWKCPVPECDKLIFRELDDCMRHIIKHHCYKFDDKNNKANTEIVEKMLEPRKPVWISWGPKSFGCKECNHRAKQSCDIKTHYRRFHLALPGTVECPLCNKFWTFTPHGWTYHSEQNCPKRPKNPDRALETAEGFPPSLDINTLKSPFKAVPTTDSRWKCPIPDCEELSFGLPESCVYHILDKHCYKLEDRLTTEVVDEMLDKLLERVNLNPVYVRCGPRDYGCKACILKSERSNNITAHFRRFHLALPGTVECPYCSHFYTFTSSQFTVHITGLCKKCDERDVEKAIQTSQERTTAKHSTTSSAQPSSNHGRPNGVEKQQFLPRKRRGSDLTAVLKHHNISPNAFHSGFAVASERSAPGSSTSRLSHPHSPSLHSGRAFESSHLTVASTQSLNDPPRHHYPLPRAGSIPHPPATKPSSPTFNPYEEGAPSHCATSVFKPQDSDMTHGHDYPSQEEAETGDLVRTLSAPNSPHSPSLHDVTRSPHAIEPRGNTPHRSSPFYSRSRGESPNESTFEEALKNLSRPNQYSPLLPQFNDTSLPVTRFDLDWNFLPH